MLLAHHHYLSLGIKPLLDERMVRKDLLLLVGERSRSAKIKREGDLGLNFIDVLTSGTTRAGERKRELAKRYLGLPRRFLGWVSRIHGVGV